MKTPTVVTLAYHKVGAPEDGAPTWYYVSAAQFAAQMKVLAESPWQAISLPTLAAALDGSETLPPLAVLVTFDDGYRHLRQTAVPILRDFGLPSAMFVPTAYIGGANTFDQGVEPHELIFTWEDLAFLRDSGVSVESHAVTHRRLSTITLDEQLVEVEQSRTVLENALGTKVRGLAYPYGDTGISYPATRDLVLRAGYELAFTYGGGAVKLDALDRFAIERVAVSNETDMTNVLSLPW